MGTSGQSSNGIQSHGPIKSVADQKAQPVFAGWAFF